MIMVIIVEINVELITHANPEARETGSQAAPPWNLRGGQDPSLAGQYVRANKCTQR